MCIRFESLQRDQHRKFRTLCCFINYKPIEKRRREYVTATNRNMKHETFITTSYTSYQHQHQHQHQQSPHLALNVLQTISACEIKLDANCCLFTSIFSSEHII